MNPPILVTGTHRSGSTWVGNMLALSPKVHYVHEPFAPMYERSWLRVPPRHRFYHESPSAPGVYAEDLDRIVHLRPPWFAIARRAGGARNVIRIAQEAVKTTAARRRGARALIKDPFALLTAEWIAQRSQADVIVLVRHPAAFASSVKRLGWRLDVEWLLDQPALMETDLEPFRAELVADRTGATDLIDHACLVWRALNTVVLRYSRDHLDWCVLRYEDLAADALPGFCGIFRHVGVPWDQRIAQAIDRLNSPGNISEVRAGSKGGTKRDSRQAMWTWLDRLSSEEIQRIHEATIDVARHWYDDDDWSPPSIQPSAT